MTTKPLTRDRIERALTTCAELIALHDDPAYVPHFEKLEAMLAEVVGRSDAMARARQLTAKANANSAYGASK